MHSAKTALSKEQQEKARNIYTGSKDSRPDATSEEAEALVKKESAARDEKRDEGRRKRAPGSDVSLCPASFSKSEASRITITLAITTSAVDVLNSCRLGRQQTLMRQSGADVE
jgi:hypothetical protein